MGGKEEGRKQGHEEGSKEKGRKESKSFSNDSTVVFLVEKQ